jgi:hypothetical protein
MILDILTDREFQHQFPNAESNEEETDIKGQKWPQSPQNRVNMLHDVESISPS